MGRGQDTQDKHDEQRGLLNILLHSLLLARGLHMM
jgi:hypothetical protein